MTGTEGKARWSVGALAKAAGLTVRTLHHYDEIGLLCPGERSPSGHRRYTEPDLHRLYQIRLLRQIGMPLTEIGDALDRGVLREVLTARVELLDQQARRLTALSQQTSALLDQLDRSDWADPVLLQAKLTVFEEYLTPEQHALMDAHVEGLDEAAKSTMDTEWFVLFRRMVEHYRAGTPEADPALLADAARLADLGRTFTGGDAGIWDSMVKFFRERGGGVLNSLTGETDFELDDDFWDYVSSAISAALSDR
ncbi:MerR family transcriptional regulator [Amycolatopsis minnesotensis]